MRTATTPSRCMAALACTVALLVITHVPLSSAELVNIGRHEFDGHIQDGRTWFVLYYAPWCGHCQRLMPTWEKLAGEFDGSITIGIGKVDCTRERPACGAQGIRSYPSLLLFKNGGLNGARYSGGRDFEDLKEYITKYDLHEEGLLPGTDSANAVGELSHPKAHVPQSGLAGSGAEPLDDSKERLVAAQLERIQARGGRVPDRSSKGTGKSPRKNPSKKNKKPVKLPASRFAKKARGIPEEPVVAATPPPPQPSSTLAQNQQPQVESAMPPKSAPELTSAGAASTLNQEAVPPPSASTPNANARSAAQEGAAQGTPSDQSK